MSETPETVSVVLERDLPWPADRVWRALTTPHLMEEWLMQTDFRPELGCAFQLRGDWGHVDCRVTEIEPGRSLAFTWVAFGSKTTVHWSLTPTERGTHLRVEQAGFSAAPEAARFVEGARHGWTGFLDKLEPVVAREG